MVNLTANRIDRLLGIAGWLMLAVAAAFVVYYVVTVPVEGSFGERFVTSEVSLFYPFNQVSVFKPITLITYFIFAGTVLLLEAYKKRVIAFDTRGVRAILLTASFASGYEVIWNFFAWFAAWEKNGGSMDILANTTHSYSTLPANFNFATKISFLVFALCLYGWFFLQRNAENGKLSRR